jgi:rSAM/selenodomain-associated transferase 1
MKTRAHLIFAKEPEPGRVKTRMTPPLSPKEAAQLSFAFIQDTLLAASDVPGADGLLFYAPEKAFPFFRKLAPPAFVLLPQEGNDFTDRCARSVQIAFERGYDRIVQIGTDTPQLCSCHMEHAFSELNDFDMVFGPTRDGGYYLLALKKPEISIYEGVVMGERTVFEKMLSNAKKNHMTVKILPEWVDADTHADLMVLAGGEGSELGRHTRHYLQQSLRFF